MSRKIQFACLFVFLGLLSTAPRSGFAQSGFATASDPPLSFGNNIFVTGDYVVAGAQGMASHMSNGFATGTITIPDANPGITGTTSVPQGAQIVGALLYWQTVEKIGVMPGQPGSGQNGFFGPVINGVPQTYAITGALPGGQNTVAFSNGGCSGSSTGKVLRTYRADVRGALPQDANGNVIVNPIGANGKPSGVYQVRLPSVGNQTPLTLGATLVIIYRVLSPNVPLNSIVIYDGDFAPGTGNLTTIQRMQGFYDAAKNPVSRLTHIVGSGQSNKFETVFLNNVPLPSLYKNNQPPFPGFYGTWDNPTWTFGGANGIALANPVHEDDSAATTQVQPNTSNQGCVSWGAMILSTTVKNNDNDGLLDSWKGAQGYCDASIKEGVCTPGDTTTGWVPLPGAKKKQKDLFVQLDYMCGIVRPDGSCDTQNGESFDPRLTKDTLGDGKDPLQKLTDAFANNPGNPINLHIFPKYAVDERDPNVTCIDSPGQPLCVFPNQPGVVGWPMGVAFLQNQLVDPHGSATVCTVQPTPANCFPRFLHGMKDSWHYTLFGHSLGLPNWTFGAGTLTNVMQSGKTVTFTTSTAPSLFPDGSCPQGRVTVAFGITNANLNGTFCATPVGQNGFSIQVGNSVTATYTVGTDPNLAVASSQADAVSGFSDIGGEHSVITLGSWGADGQTWQAKTGTFMHELGHSLGLTHGGLYFDKVAGGNPNDFTPTVEANCKSNQQTVMSYMFQVDLLQKQTGVDGGGNPLYMQVPDYSEQLLPTLIENSGGAAGVLPVAFYPKTGLFVPFAGQGSPVNPHCDGTPVLDGAQVSYTTPFTNALSFFAGQDINFDGNSSESLRGHNDWVGTASAPGVDLRQIGATGSLSAAGGLIGLGGGGGLTGLGGGGGLTGLGGGGGLIGLGGGGGLTGLGGGGGLTGLGGGGGLTGLGGGGGLTGLGGGGGLPELTRAAANAYTRVPQNLTATEAGSPRTITLNWLRPTFGIIGAYNVYRSEAGGLFTFLKTVPVANNPQSISTTDTVTCDPGGFRYEVSALLAPNNTQESARSNIAPAPGQDLLTGCYIGTQNTQPTINLPGFSSPAVNAVFTQGDTVPITWSLFDDHYTTNGSVINTSAARLLAIGPLPHAGACPSPSSVPVPPAPGTFTVLSSGGTGVSFSNNKFTFNWTTTMSFPAGCWVIEADFDSGQYERTEVDLRIFVSDSGPFVVTTALPDGVVGSTYNNTVQQSGGTGTITWSILSGFGNPPPGISFDPDHPGVLTGTPIVPGIYTFTVQATDSVGNFGTRTLTLRVADALFGDLIVVDGSLSTNPLSGTLLRITPTGTSGTIATISNGSPTGVAIDPTTGNIFVAVALGTPRIVEVTRFGIVSDFVPGGVLTNPVAVAVDSLRNVYVGDNNRDAIYKFNSSGAQVDANGSPTTNRFASLPSSPTNLQDIRMTFDSAGNLIVASDDIGDVSGIVEVDKIDPTGNLTVLYNTTTNSSLMPAITSVSGIAAFADGSIDVADFTMQMIYKITNPGAPTMTTSTDVNSATGGLCCNISGMANPPSSVNTTLYVTLNGLTNGPRLQLVVPQGNSVTTVLSGAPLTFPNDVAWYNLSPIRIDNVNLSPTTLSIGGANVPYTATLLNGTGATVSSVLVQTYIDQGTASRAAGGAVVTCVPTPSDLPPGSCNFNFSVVASNSTGGTGTLVPGGATARFELRNNNTLFSVFTVPVTLQ